MVRRIGSLLLCVMVSGVAVFAAPIGSAQSQDEMLEVSTDCVLSADEIGLAITFRNIGASDTSAYLGRIVGNGSKYLANELVLDVRVGDETQRYNYFDPSVAAFAGRLDPWVIALPFDTSFSLARPTNHFRANGVPLSQLSGSFEFRVRFDVKEVPKDFGIPRYRAFVGEIRSDWVQVPGGCRSAA